jgi:hypothetical protein
MDSVQVAYAALLATPFVGEGVVSFANGVRLSRDPHLEISETDTRDSRSSRVLSF